MAIEIKCALTKAQAAQVDSMIAASNMVLIGNLMDCIPPPRERILDDGSVVRDEPVVNSNLRKSLGEMQILYSKMAVDAGEQMHRENDLERKVQRQNENP